MNKKKSFFALYLKIFQAYLFGFLFLLFIPNVSIFSTPTIEVNTTREFNVLKNVEYSMRYKEVEDSELLLSSVPEDWKKMKPEEIFFYVTPGENLWMRFEIQNIDSEHLFLIRIKEFLFDTVECFIYHQNGDFKRMSAGNLMSILQKDIHTTDSVFPIYLSQNEKAKIFLKFKSSVISASYIRIQPINSFLEWNTEEMVLFGGYFGFLVFMWILCLGIFYYLRDYAYLFYFIFLLFYGLFDFSKNSLFTYFFLPTHTHLNLDFLYLFLILSLSAGALFSRLFLNLKYYSPILDKIVLYASLIILLFIPIPYWSTENLFYFISPIGLVFLLVIYFVSFYVHSKGFGPAKYFIIGWGFTIFGVLISLFASRYFIWAGYASEAGSTLQIFFMVFAMLSKANRTQLEKNRIEEVATDYKKEFVLAGEIQQSLLPKAPPQVDGFEIHSFFLPMKGIGGDYYDFHSRNEHSFSAIMADVSGHGPSAALIASMVKLAFAETFSLYDRPEKAIRKMNSSLFGNLGKKFVTAVYAHFNYRNRSLTYCSAGHPPILIHRRSEDKILQLDSKGNFLGWFSDIKVREHTYKLQSGDRILIYTDGLIEAFNKEKEMFDYDRLEMTLRANQNFSAQEFSYFLIYRIKEWVGLTEDFEDDITFTIIDVK